MTVHPYAGLPPERYWRSGVADLRPAEITNVYRRKFAIAPTDAVASSGSCFAQHIGDHLKRGGYEFVDYEPPPPLLPTERHRDFGYSIYSARYGNVYTARQLLQLVDRAFERFQPRDAAWEQDGRWFDPYRPTVEVDGFDSLEELELCRAHHLQRVRALFQELNVFVFTLGLTEAWCNDRDGAVYPMCPGTVAGIFDSSAHVFVNFNWAQVHSDLRAFLDRLWDVNRAARVVLTVSPVPLAATATSNHVLVATTYSKAVLRAVAGQIADQFAAVDYFPSYELITGAPFRSTFFEPNLRSVTRAGVEFVMSHFFREHGVFDTRPDANDDRVIAARLAAIDDEVCEERILEMFR